MTRTTHNCSHVLHQIFCPRKIVPVFLTFPLRKFSRQLLKERRKRSCWPHIQLQRRVWLERKAFGCLEIREYGLSRLFFRRCRHSGNWASARGPHVVLPAPAREWAG